MFHRSSLEKVLVILILFDEKKKRRNDLIVVDIYNFINGKKWLK